MKSFWIQKYFRLLSYAERQEYDRKREEEAAEYRRKYITVSGRTSNGDSVSINIPRSELYSHDAGERKSTTAMNFDKPIKLMDFDENERILNSFFQKWGLKNMENIPSSHKKSQQEYPLYSKNSTINSAQSFDSPIIRDNKISRSELRLIEQAVIEKRKWLLEKFLEKNNILFSDIIAEMRSRLSRSPENNSKKYIRKLLRELQWEVKK